jgi:hypothetical protein
MAEIQLDTVKFTHEELKSLYGALAVVRNVLIQERAHSPVSGITRNPVEELNQVSNLMVVLETYFAGEVIPKAQCPTCGMRGTTPCVRGRKFSTIWDKKEPLGKSHDSRVAADMQEKWVHSTGSVHQKEEAP